jgi:hypothetical protein
MKLFHWRLPLRALAILCTALLVPGDALIYAQPEQVQNPARFHTRALQSLADTAPQGECVRLTERVALSLLLTVRRQESARLLARRALSPRPAERLPA